MRIAIYARQSLDKKDSVSIQAQIEACNLHCKEGDSVAVYSDKGFSGKNTHRPDFEKLINNVQRDLVDTIIVYKLDRFSRNVLDFYTMWEVLETHHCNFISCSENFDTTSIMGKAMVGILMIFAQMERESISQRVKDNYYYRAQTKKSWLGGPAPYGFANDKENKTLTPNKKEQEAILAMFDLYGLDRNIFLSLGAVARKLSERGYVSRKRDTFNNVTIARILQNPIYCTADERLYNYYKSRKIKFLNPKEEWDGTHTAHIIGKRAGNTNVRSYTDLSEQSIYITPLSPLVDSDIFLKVQEKLSSNQSLGRANKVGNLLELTGMLKCKKCGYAIKLNGKKYLTCHGRSTLHLCDAAFSRHVFTFEEIRNRVYEEVDQKLKNLEKYHKQKLADYDKLTARKKELETQMDNIIAVLGESTVLKNAPNITAKLEEIQREITGIIEQQNAMEFDFPIYDNVIMGAVSFNFMGTKQEMDRLQKHNEQETFIHMVTLNRSIFKRLFSKIEVAKSGELTIHWNM